ncbi:WAT1-related protein [Senna tora]|uniref:WAT1-related protein n=1 Tax=Senna tora TaxID=362788 RepID=A0A835CGL8_9FABA|nr:WAT1-related protein [Senna tora]
MGGLEGHLPAMGMIVLQVHYAVQTMLTRAALLHGMSTRVFVSYRQAIATLALAPLVFSSTKRLEKIDVRSLRSLAKILGTALCVGGAMIMALLKGQKLLHMEFLLSRHAFGLQGDNWLLGCVLLLICCFTWSFWLIMQVPISSSCPDHVLSTFWFCFMATIQTTIFTLVFEPDFQAWHLDSPIEYSSCLYTGIGTAISFFIQCWCISERGPLFCAMFNPLCTVITAIISITLLHEELYVGSLIGAFGVITGLYIVLWGKAKETEGIKGEAKPNVQDDEIHCKIDLEEPLLAEKSENITESKMNV